MKKIIFCITDDTTTKNVQDCIQNNNSLCRILIIDTELSEDYQDFKFITLKPNIPDRIDAQLIRDLLDPENKVFIMTYDKDDLDKINDQFRFCKSLSPGGKGKKLSQRQWDVLDCLAQGMTYNEIADCLNISFHTVKTHLSDSYKIICVKGKSEAVHWYFKNKMN
jgi:DNA-binding CsgD family transcriptional regulator